MKTPKKPLFFAVVFIAIAFMTIVFIEGSYLVYRMIKKRDPISTINLNTIFLMNDDAVGYVLKPGASTRDLPDWERKKDEYDNKCHGLGKLMSTNSSGYRGKCYGVEKPDRVFRVLVLGGSTTWGCFNNDDETWPEYLENALKKELKDKKVEVINAAVTGYTSYQNLEMVKKIYRFYSPDVVLIACWFNDMYNRSESFPSPWADFDVQDKNNICIRRYSSSWWYPFPGGTFFYNRARDFIRHLKIYMALPEDFRKALQRPDREFFSQFYSDDKLWIKNYFKNVNGIISAVKSSNPDAKFYVIAMPTFFVPGSPFDFKEYFTLVEYDINMYNRPYLHSRSDYKLLFLTYYHHTILFQKLVESKKHDLGYGLILGYPALGMLPIQERSRYFDDEIHLTAAGNLLLAQDVARQLVLNESKQ